MKKMIVALALAGGVAAFAYASLHNRNSDKQAIEKQEKKRNEKRMQKKMPVQLTPLSPTIRPALSRYRGAVFFSQKAHFPAGKNEFEDLSYNQL